MQQKASYLGTVLSSFPQAHAASEAVLETVLGVKRLERLTEGIGTERVDQRDESVEAWRRRTLIEKEQAPPGVKAPELAAVIPDGGRLQLRERNPKNSTHWFEYKAGCLLEMQSQTHETDPSPELPALFLQQERMQRLTREIGKKSADVDEPVSADEPPEGDKAAERPPAELPEPPKIASRDVVATLRGSRDFAPILAARAWELGFFGAARKAYVGDGSSWIWTMFDRYFQPYGFVPILDFIHALTYVYAAATAGRTPSEGWPVYVRWITWVWQGRVAQVIVELALSQDYVGRSAILRASLVRELGLLDPAMETAAGYDLVLRVAGRARAVAHMPMALFQRGEEGAGRPSCDQDDQLRAVGAALKRRGMKATLQPDARCAGIVRIQPQAQTAAPVAIVIPTQDRHELLKTCIDSILEKTTYPNYEIVVVDNDSRDEQTRRLLEDYARDHRVRVVPVPGEFNFSRLNNAAVAACRSEYVLLLNNDTEVIVPHWLDVMVAWAEQPGIGAVGAKLYFTKGTLQHSGVVLRGEGSGSKPCFHSHKKFAGDSAGYLGLLCSTCNYSGVTGACLLLPREVYEAVDGLDERLAVAYNDIDLCLKVIDAGLRVVWSPEVELFHHESASRTTDSQRTRRWKVEQKYMHGKWKEKLCNDPYYNPNLSIERSNFSLATPDDTPRTKTWRLTYPFIPPPERPAAGREAA